MSEISEEATRLIDEFECAAEDAVSDYTMACGASYKNLARHNLEDYIAELEAERLELRKTLGWAYDLDEYKDNPEVQKMYNKFNQNHRSKNERQILQER